MTSWDLRSQSLPERSQLESDAIRVESFMREGADDRRHVRFVVRVRVRVWREFVDRAQRGARNRICRRSCVVFLVVHRRQKLRCCRGVIVFHPNIIRLLDSPGPQAQLPDEYEDRP